MTNLTPEELDKKFAKNEALARLNPASKIAPESTREGIKAQGGNNLPISEADWQKTVIDLLHAYGYKVCEFRKARLLKKGVDVYRTPFGADGEGFPDLIAARLHSLLFIECKSEQGKMSEKQKNWMGLLASAGEGEYILARPQDYDYLVKRLR